MRTQSRSGNTGDKPSLLYIILFGVRNIIGRMGRVGMQIGDSYVHPNPIQFKILYYFLKIKFYFKKIVQNLKRIGGTPKDCQFVPLDEQSS